MQIKYALALSPPTTVEIRAGAPPATCNAPDSGTLLSTLTWRDDSHWGGIVLKEGVPGHFRVKCADGTPLLQGTAGCEPADDLRIEDGASVSEGLEILLLLPFSITASTEHNVTKNN